MYTVSVPSKSKHNRLTNFNCFSLFLALEGRSKQRLNVLLNLIQLEDVKLYRELGGDVRPLMNPKHNTERHLATRPTLKRIYRVLSTLEEMVGLKFNYSYEIPHLNLMGVTGYERTGTYKRVYVEVVDESVRLKNRDVGEDDLGDGVNLNDVVNGFMSAKLRVLDKRDEALLVVSSDTI